MRQETFFDVSLSPLRTWGLLADLCSYGSWHPRYTFDTDPELGGRVDFTFLFMKDRRVRTDVEVTAFEKPNTIGWKLAFGDVFACLEERYEVERVGIGSRVHHSMEWRGLTSVFFRGGAARLLAFLEAYDAAFIAQVRRVARSGPVGNRHARRAASPGHVGRAAND